MQPRALALGTVPLHTHQAKNFVPEGWLSRAYRSIGGELSDDVREMAGGKDAAH